MPSITPLKVNGIAYSFRDIRFGGLPGISQIRPYVRAINFTNVCDGALNHGASQLGRKVSGAYTPTFDFEIAQEGLILLHRILPPLGFEKFPIGNVEMSYAKAQTVPPFLRNRFINVFILGNSASWSQGTTELVRRVPTVVQAVLEDHGDGVWRCPIDYFSEALGS